MGPDGVKLTRDGRFHYDKDGNLLTLENEKVLGIDGTPIVLPCIPENPEDIIVDLTGKMRVVDRPHNKVFPFATISVVSSDGAAVLDPGVRQGFTEDSNVILNEEFMNAFPVKKTFAANKAMFQQCNSLVSAGMQKLSQM